jgi:hypothetical protein
MAWPATVEGSGSLLCIGDGCVASRRSREVSVRERNVVRDTL